MARQVPVVVPFDGGRAADGPLTLGQYNILQWLERHPEDRNASLQWTFEIPQGTRVTDVADIFATLLARHEGLRTTYDGAGRDAVQRVAGDGELLIEVFAVEPGEMDTVGEAAVAATLTDRLAVESVPAGSLPLRVGVATASGAVVACVAQYSHLAVDYQAMIVIAREFAQMLGNPAAREVGPRRYQPLDLALDEANPELPQRMHATLAYWERELTRMPPFLYAGTCTEANGESGAVMLSSPTAALALRHVAERTRVSRPTIVLAALSAVLSRVSGYDVCRFPILSGNRTDPRLANYVGTLVQTTLFAVETINASFDVLVRRTYAAVLNAGRFGRYDIYRRVDLAERLRHERGVEFRYDPLFNNLVPDGQPPRGGKATPVEAVAAAAHRTRLRWQAVPATTRLLGFELARFDGAVQLLAVTGDIGRISRRDLESLALATERLLIAAAVADLEPDAIRDTIGLEPAQGGPGWVLVDGCWVRLADVCRLVDAALAPDASGIVVSRGRQLVAYVAAGGGIVTPEQAHSRCLAALSTHRTAITPQWYVICTAAPSDRADVAGWLRQPVRGEGSGRTLAPR